ncbi:protein OSB4, chloroplastic-like [Rutidosis leptorrhynchoides]|uniref:protein OSB4, chloroplastic-like n=1 Tax=Rutidosis leptorrhynchoides TaxID=125765 RepID=UPI003A9A540F
MNPICRALMQIASSQPTRELMLVLRLSCVSQPYSTASNQKSTRTARVSTTKKVPEETSQMSTEAPPPPSQSLNVATDHQCVRPTEIPYQAKVANSVNLIGYVQMPIKSEIADDGKFWAGTIISQDATSDSPPLWIPVLFEGDLGRRAFFHLKENDRVYVTGKLAAVHEDPPPFNKSLGQANVHVQVMADSVNFVESSSWKKENPVTFEQEEGILKHSVSATVKKDGNANSDIWSDVLENPNMWRDYRSAKRDGSVITYPETEVPHIDTSNETKVLNSFDKSKQAKMQKGKELWKDVIDNPGKWWDNRLDKMSPKYPDFKHKDSGEGLWLDSCPEWIKSKLPAPAPKRKDTTFGKQDTLLS